MSLAPAMLNKNEHCCACNNSSRVQLPSLHFSLNEGINTSLVLIGAGEVDPEILVKDNAPQLAPHNWLFWLLVEA